LFAAAAAAMALRIMHARAPQNRRWNSLRLGLVVLLAAVLSDGGAAACECNRARQT